MSAEARSAEWVRLSLSLQRFEPFMMVAVQGLGRLDAELAEADRIFLALPEPDKVACQTASPFDLADRVTRSYLWVLGAYEIVRVLDQRFRAGAYSATEAQKAKANQTKQRFARLRMPLAKFEPARDHSSTDSAIAFPVIHEEHGIAWRIADTTFVAREELAQALRELLEMLSDDGEKCGGTHRER